MRTIGIDPGSRATGWAVLDDGDLVASGVIYSGSSDKMERYRNLAVQLDLVLGEFSPDDGAVESTFIRKFPNLIMSLGEARGIILSGLLRAGVDVFSYAPATVKKVVAGHGRATKDQVATVVKQRHEYGDGSSTDETDAIAIAMTHEAKSAE